ncbi:MAG: PAS domain S-box protein [Ignavibacteriaceae bacterium]
MNENANHRTGEAEERFGSFFENTVIGLYRTTPEGEIILANPRLISMLGFSSFEELSNRNLEEESEEGVFHRNLFKQLIEKNEEILGFESVWRRKDDSLMYIREHAKVHKDHTGKIVYYEGVVEDITERKLAEQAQQKLELEFRSVWENSASGMRITDVHGIVLRVNNAFCRIVEKSKEEMEGKPLSVIYSDKERKRIQTKHSERVLSKTVETNFEKQLELWNGKKIWIHVANSYLGDDGKENLQLGIFTDITERKNSEIQLAKYATELKNANDMKNKLFSIIAHDLRGPFSGFLGLSDILTNELETLSNEEIRDFSSELNASLHKQFELLNDLLNWARLQREDFHLNTKMIRLTNLVSKVFELLSLLAANKEIKLRNDVPENLLVFADADMLKLVVRNLVSNAIKFTGSGGVVFVEAHDRVAFTEITVSDSGVGIVSKDLKKIFSEQITFTTQGTNKEKGTGLGLMLCKEVVEKHSGRIWVESEPGKGSNFTFTIPNNSAPI